MVNYREIIRLKSQNYSNQSVANSCGSSRNTVAQVWMLVQTHDLTWPIPEELTNEDLGQILYPGRGINGGRRLPNFEYMHNELAKPGVTLSLLWAEYCEECAREQTIPYQHSQYYDKYRAYAMSKKATLRIKRKPGELLEVDWVGDTLSVHDVALGKSIPAYVFIASLACSGYSYSEAFPDMKQGNWITAHVHAFSHFGGTTRILVPDNLKTGIIKNSRNELIINRSYHEMAEYYQTAIIPARPSKPRDKPSVEGNVKTVETWIMAALRNRKFFTFSELNDAIREKLDKFNAKDFQKKNGSRLSAFEEEEKSYLIPLPASPYETAVWSTATIQPDYLISVEDCKYSVPYEFIGKEVDIRTSDRAIEVFYRNRRITSHMKVAYADDPIYLPEHMPEKHRKYLQYNSESFLEWSQIVGTFTHTVVKYFLSMHKVEERGYRSCTSIMKLADRYSTQRLEAACEKALSYTDKPSLKNITTILKNGQDKVIPEAINSGASAEYGITRGASYFKGGDQK